MSSDMVASRYYETTYSQKDVARLCEIGGFVPNDLDEFREELEELAAIYRYENARFQNLPSYKAVSAELINIQKQAARLSDSLQRLGWEARRAIEKGIDADSIRMITEGIAAPEHPSLFLSLNSRTDELMGVNVDIPDLKAILGGLQNAAHAGQQELRKRPSRKIPDYGLRLWLSNIENRWTQMSPHPFSRDIDRNGEPITYAGRFCVAAFKKIEPSYSTSRIMNGIKNLKKERRKPSGKAG
ncbi:hypothetical protein HGF13_09845 [Rhodobacteraceae bacterium R_SAG5]|nr:hypothetical protein [Rhodobacteraceae bacterium R_SAG5]